MVVDLVDLCLPLFLLICKVFHLLVEVLAVLLQLVDVLAGLVFALLVLSHHVLVSWKAATSVGDCLDLLLEALNTQLYTVLTGAESVDFLEKGNIFLHNSGVFLLVDGLLLAQLPSVVLKSLLELSSLLVVDVGGISFVCLVVALLVLHVSLVELDDALLQLLVVAQVVVERVVDVIFEFPLGVLLFVDMGLDALLLHHETLELLFQVLNDQLEVVVDDFEVFDFILHLGLLLVENLNFLLIWANIVF